VGNAASDRPALPQETEKVVVKISRAQTERSVAAVGLFTWLESWTSPDIPDASCS
jgi:hypothetical protein